LIGGLGLGFTLQATLTALGPKVAVDVVELLPAVVEWNRTHMAGLNGSCLENDRVKVIEEDINHWVRSAPARSYDAVILDVDNGPIAMVDRKNSSLYSETGIKKLRRLLRPGGRLAIWSAGRDKPFETRLQGARLPVEVTPSRAYHGAKREAVAIYVIRSTN